MVVRATLAGLLCVLLAACGGGRADRPAPAPEPAAGPSLTLTVVSVPLDCRPAADLPPGCRAGGSGLAGGLGKVRVYQEVKLGQPRAGGCTEAGVAGSLSGAGWSVPFGGSGEWCGQRARFTYRLRGQPGGQGRLEYRHEPPAAATETFSGALPAPPPETAGRDPGPPRTRAGCAKQPPARPGRAVDLEVPADPALAAGASSRSYRVHVPAGYRPRRPLPAVLFFHGNGGSAADMDADSGLSELADRHGFLAVYPQGLAVGAGKPFWAGAGRVDLGVDDLRFTADLLDDLQERLCVDPARVHAGGFSAGGGVTAWLACDLAGRVAAVATVAGAHFAEPGDCRPARPMPVLAVHGTSDEVIPYGGLSPSLGRPLRLPSVPAWLAGWAARDGCTVDAAVFLDTREVTGARWSGCRGGAEVVHYRVNGGGHQAPRRIAGRSLAEVLWEFFAAHPLPR
ncbi:MAG TPA: PHB depolymerase family esterase [Actinomycetes bacterium]|nr:PHB depolymerase family esterase [Actinomycetes bacterium]